MMKRLIPAIVLLALSLGGCAHTPVGVDVVSPREAYLDAYANPLSSGVTGDNTNVVLNRFNLLEKFKEAPAEVIATLHEKALMDDRRDILFALAETSYLYGDQLSKRYSRDDQRLAADYFLLSAIYSYRYLLEDRPEPPPHQFDPRLRTASSLYNFSLWRAFATGEDGKLVLEAQTRQLPIGDLSITINLDAFPWKLEEFEKFEPADRFAARGVSVRDRSPGMGLPLVGLQKATIGSLLGGAAVPVTVFLKLDSMLAEFKGSGAKASLEFYTTLDYSEVDVNGKIIPLETDITTPLAYRLEGSRLWDFGIGAFIGKEFDAISNGLYQVGPYLPGRIPVVFVHGTASSPVWWAEMLNTLRADPTLRKKFQFWFFIYKSNSLVAMSAADLRTALQERISVLDPAGKDGALQQMVVIGHSQGGLLTKFTAVDTGDKLARALLGKDIENLHTSAENRELLRRLLVIKPLPFVKQVVFIATPHRGSFRSTGLVRTLVAKLIRLPITVLSKADDLRGLLTDDIKTKLKGRVPTSIDGMSPDNPMIRALAEIPLGPGIHGHSIIAIKDESTPPQGDDGVVLYTSAHLDGMDSEFIVRSEHSCQMHPFTIEEVRRILLEHLASQNK